MQRRHEKGLLENKVSSRVASYLNLGTFFNPKTNPLVKNRSLIGSKWVFKRPIIGSPLSYVDLRIL